MLIRILYRIVQLKQVFGIDNYCTTWQRPVQCIQHGGARKGVWSFLWEVHRFFLRRKLMVNVLKHLQLFEDWIIYRVRRANSSELIIKINALLLTHSQLPCSVPATTHFLWFSGATEGCSMYLSWSWTFSRSSSCSATKIIFNLEWRILHRTKISKILLKMQTFHYAAIISAYKCFRRKKMRYSNWSPRRVSKKGPAKSWVLPGFVLPRYSHPAQKTWWYWHQFRSLASSAPFFPLPFLLRRLGTQHWFAEPFMRALKHSSLRKVAERSQTQYFGGFMNLSLESATTLISLRLTIL